MVANGVAVSGCSGDKVVNGTLLLERTEISKKTPLDESNSAVGIAIGVMNKPWLTITELVPSTNVAQLGQLVRQGQSMMSAQGYGGITALNKNSQVCGLSSEPGPKSEVILP